MIRSEMIKILLAREFRRLMKNPSALMLLGLQPAVRFRTKVINRVMARRHKQPSTCG